VTVAGAAHHSVNLGVMAVSSALALGGIILAWLIYQRLAIPAAGLRRRYAPVYDLLWHKFYIDELYAWLISRVVDGLARLFYWFDITVINGAVNGLARLTGRSGQALRYTENGQVQTYGLYLLAGTLMILFSVLVAAAAAQG
jgi:NADH-quinone oxidoreductase subunit L